MILLDSGVTGLRNIGDQALLEETLEKYPGTVLEADYPIHGSNKINPLCWIRYLRKVVRAQHIHLVSGGLFTDTQKKYVFRKYLTILLARFLRKKVTVGAQTFNLTGLMRILFRICFRNIVVPARDHTSLKDLHELEIKSYFEKDMCIQNSEKKLILIDTRLLNKYQFKTIPTINTDKTRMEIEKAISEANLVLTCSFHCAVFALNQKVPVVALIDSEYYRRKFSSL